MLFRSFPPQSGFDADRDLSRVEDPAKALRASGSRVAAAATPQSVAASVATAAIPGTSANFEGLSNQDNFNVFGGRVNPPDPVGDVGPNHYVEMINLVFGVYSKTGTLLLGPVDTGTLWSGFAVDDCTDPSGDPIVVYDQAADRWILTQFTTRGLDDPTLPFYNCVAISTTGDPTGSYYRYAFTTGFNFPDYPKYGIYGDTYINTSREFGPNGEYGIGVYGFERAQMIKGNPNARSVSFFLDGNDPDILPLVGDGLLPPDMDGPANKGHTCLKGRFAHQFARSRDRTQSMKFWKWLTSGPSISGIAGPSRYSMRGKLRFEARIETPVGRSGSLPGVKLPWTVFQRSSDEM